MTKKVTAKKSTATAIKKYDVGQPAQLEQMSRVLKGFIVKNQLYTQIKGKNYAHVDGWQFAGALLGLHAVVTDVEDLSKASEVKWKAKVEVRNMKSGEVVSVGVAICSNKESKKKSFDEYAVLSMAQTRAIGKAYRNILGWVLKLAGYDSTPSEEMAAMGVTPDIPAQDIKKGPEGEKVVVCQNCDSILTPQVAAYSKKMYGKYLCRDCQPKKTTAKKK